MTNKMTLQDFLSQTREDHRFDCHDWMEQAGYTQEQRMNVLKFSNDVGRLAMEHMQRKPVPQWTANDWEEHERFQWECTDIFREMLKGYFTDEQIKEIVEAWEHDRYVHHYISDGYGRMHHCQFCREAVV